MATKREIKIGILWVSAVSMMIWAAVYMHQYRRDSIVFSSADQFSLPNDLNISIPKGYSMRIEYVTYSGLMGSSDVYGWYFSKSSCRDVVKMPDPDKTSSEDGKLIKNFFPFHPDMDSDYGVTNNLAKAGICAEVSADGKFQAYADKVAKERLGLNEVVSAIQGGIKYKARHDRWMQEDMATESKRKESWSTAATGDKK